MPKKISGIILFVLMSAFLLTGCQSPAGAKLTKALAKQIQIKTYSCETNASFKHTVEDPTIAENTDEILMNDIFSNISLNINQTYDNPKNLAKVTGYAKLNGITGDYEFYLKGTDLWARYPMFSKYIQVSLTKTQAESEEFLALKNKLSELAMEFASKYILSSDYQLKNIKDNGNKSIKTAKGTYTANEIEVTMDNKEAFNFIKYCINELLDSPDFREFLIEAVKVTDGEDAVDAQFEKDLDNFLKYQKAEFNKYYTEPDGLTFSTVLRFYIDKSGYIVRMTSNSDFKYEYEKTDYSSSTLEKVKVVRNIKSEIVTDIYDINKPVSITYPEFNSENTVSFDNYLDMDEDRISVKETIEEELERMRSQYESSIEMGEYNYARIRGKYTEVNDKYTKNGTMYLPVRVMAEILNAEVSVNGSKVTLTGKDKTLDLYVNSKKAVLNGTEIANSYPVEVKNGLTMVPARFVAEAFGAKVSVEYNTMIIQPEE